MALVIVGALSLQPTVPDAFKAVAIIALQLATSAVGSIAIARSAYLTGTPLYEPRFDELAEESDPEEREEARQAREERETPRDVE
jgi:multicomponent Na+:H+ antiporter subunit G